MVSFTFLQTTEISDQFLFCVNQVGHNERVKTSKYNAIMSLTNITSIESTNGNLNSLNHRTNGLLYYGTPSYFGLYLSD